MKGAEAILSQLDVLGLPAVEKVRLKKTYRATALDERIRRERTRQEVRLLSKAKEAGVLCPVVYEVTDFAIRMGFLQGEMLYHALSKGRKATSRELASAAQILVALHSAGIVHGDFTPANLMNTRKGMAVIDFGLGSISSDPEDQGTDLVTMKKALGRQGIAFLEAYGRAGGKKSVLRMCREIEGRARYMERG
jgi:Kae1-associated kinase Bud32